jgi:hypothetical protein
MAAPERPEEEAPFEQDPLVEHLRPEPSAKPTAAVTLEGLAGRSARAGYARLYFNTALSYYAEFATADMLFREAIPADELPFPGHKATRVAIRQDAVIEYTRTVTAKAIDPYALDPRQIQRTRPVANLEPATIGIECPTQPFGCPTDQTCGCHTARTDCVCPTDNTCRTDCFGVTCDTCRTQCDQATCATCNQATCATCNQATCVTCNTCATQCNQATCNTCATQCNQATCNTCRTDCGGRTCVTCDTCNPHVFTCGNQRGCI